MLFLSRSLIVADLKREAQSVADGLWAMVDILDFSIGDKALLGYIITKGGVEYTVAMKFPISTNGLLQVDEEDWVLSYSGVTVEGFRDLTLVTDYIEELYAS